MTDGITIDNADVLQKAVQKAFRGELGEDRTQRIQHEKQKDFNKDQQDKLKLLETRSDKLADASSTALTNMTGHFFKSVATGAVNRRDPSPLIMTTFHGYKYILAGLKAAIAKEEYEAFAAQLKGMSGSAGFVAIENSKGNRETDTSEKTEEKEPVAHRTPKPAGYSVSAPV